MQDVLGLLAFILFCAAIVAAAAGITWLVVRLAPPKKPDAVPKT
ncbi:MAG TPA: hypothetical protein VGG88_00270 [Gaiellaceae bacterium]|jgi:hypothetical protein